MKTKLFFIFTLLWTFTFGQVKFHDTKGNIEVNGVGKLQFTLPIAIPPGIKTVAPQINLAYTSGSGNGIAGYGWSLSGITSISRVGKTIEKDGELQSIKIDYSDYYSFNGQRLILKSGEYGKDGAEYYTEKYSNVKIKSIGNVDYWKQPLYWEITFEDGSQAWYGRYPTADNNSTDRKEFNISKWKDVSGNVILYNYAQDNSIPVITSIKWGGNEQINTPFTNEIVFNYIDRDLKETAWVNGTGNSSTVGTLFIQTKLLKDIIVKTNNQQFKKYSLDYIKNNTNYQFLKNITEYNSNNEAANPITFEYPAFSGPDVVGVGSSPVEYDKVKYTADLNGDSYLDFIFYNGLVRLGAFNNSFTDINTGKVFNSTAKVVNTLIDEDGQAFNGNGIVQFEDGYLCGYIFKNNSFVKVFNKLITVLDCPPNTLICNISAKLEDLDINGDGIEDVIVNVSKRVCFAPAGGDGGLNKTDDESKLPVGTQCNTIEIGNYIVDLKNPNLALSNLTVDNNITFQNTSNEKFLDVNGDGVGESINVSTNDYTVFEYVKTGVNEYLKRIKYSGSLIDYRDPEFPVLFGDYNGDGKLDFAIPVAQKSPGIEDWRFYIGTGKGFNSIFYENFIGYKKRYSSGTDDYRNIKEYFLSVGDLNKDGKSDIVQVFSYSEMNIFNSTYRNFGYAVTAKISNGAFLNNEPSFVSSLAINDPPGWTNDITDFALYVPISYPLKSNNTYYDLFVMRKDWLMKVKHQSPLDELARIKSITQGGITTQITYTEAIPDNNSNVYKKTKKEYFPYLSLERADKSYVVSQLQQLGRKQDFRYRGLTLHLEGKGMIGFNQSARSSWYADGFENTKVWSGVEIDPQNEGLPIKEWSIKTNDENKIFPTNISETNTELLSYKSTSYKTDRLVNGQVVTTVLDADKPKEVLAILPESSVTKDFLTNTVTNSTITYGDYYLPVQTVTNVNNGFAITTSNFEYFHNPSGSASGYYIGRPKTKISTVQAYGDSKSSKEEYTYEYNLLKTAKAWNRDNSGYLLETYNYDDYGNIIKKIISNSIDAQTQTTKADYEPKGRFVVKKTDNLGLETNITYNNWGQLLTQTDPLGNTLSNTYDAWGKLLSSETNLGGTTTYQYERDTNSNIIISQTDSDGNTSKKYTNKLGQDYKSSTKAFAQGQYVSVNIQYDAIGRKIAESEPYFEGLQGISQWNTLVYDDNYFPAKVKTTSFTGKQVETSVSGLITTVKEINGYARITSKTTDVLGNVITSTDKGGIVNFLYNAAGELIQAKYEQNTVTTKYDSWGRKSEFNDPSNGKYTYEYDGLGQSKKITSPKGTKEYTLNSLGQLITQKELSNNGTSTNKIISFQYDNKGRVISKTGISNGKTYSSNIDYDPHGRVISYSEDSNGKIYKQQGITYDSKGRVISYEKSLFSSGVLTNATIENIYSSWSGVLYQIKDKSSGKILWNLLETNAKGQILNLNLGKTNIINTYDGNDFLTNINHEQLNAPAGTPNILNISYSFDAIKNELISRNTLGDFNILENFNYDDNNRLISWTNPRTGQLSNNTYDSKGRITQNDQVGTIKFENSSKIYQPTSMTLHPVGDYNYLNDLVQYISYNENNDPIFIDGKKGDVAFEYGLTSMRQKVTYGGNFTSTQEGKFTKYYSEDGGFEVIKDNITGKEKHILYIGGTPYESNILYMKNYDEGTGSYKFLHKDYLGSILAITDEDGNKLEQRHFDAWGNLTHLQIGNGAILTDKAEIEVIIQEYGLLLDRGYTSHEHFFEVGIIHMNGRLYDPLLRRFLNADENIQDPYNTQNYNKYGYVLNNPLMFSDPSGETFEFAALVAVMAKAAFMAMVLTAATYTVKAIIDGKFSINAFFKSISYAVAWSIPTSALSYGIGTIFSTASVTAFLGKTGTIIARAGTHAISMGVLSSVSGGTFWSGALSAAFSSVTGDLLQGAGESSVFRSDAAKMAAGMVTGGTGSILAGGNFWQGALQGLFVMAFNHLEHKIGSSFKVYDDDGDYVGKIKVAAYDEYTDPNTGEKGVHIELQFNSASKKYSDYSWVQTVYTNNAFGSDNEYRTYNDLHKPYENKGPFYYAESDYIKYPRIKQGNQYLFTDTPMRGKLNFNIGWRGEVSLVGINTSGRTILHTFWYGFNYYSYNHLLLMPIVSKKHTNNYLWLKK